ncbi:MAG: hypothetical protein EA385_11130 [Salinarimonadaceae bacterium]|nr:MAG: hypothetical protein EA385_11130 [Salinarimonadaceae bacterium]
MSGVLRALGLPFREAVAFFLQKTNLPTRRWQDNYGRSNARAFSIAGAMTDALLSDFRGEITRALADGASLSEFRGRFDEIVTKHGWDHVGEPGWRARVIYETNLSTAYSAGRYAQMTEPETLAAFPYWQYVHSGARHPREEHQAWDGLILRADDVWWDVHYPPNGWGCGCRVRVLSERGLRRLGRDGPDAAPRVELIPHKDRKTGETRMVPSGVDPGFEYNPGKAWKEAG